MAFNCKLPWQGMIIGDRSVSPCCNFSWSVAAPSTVVDFVNSKELQQVRRQILQGQAPHQCNKCVKQEQLTGHSMRTYSNLYEDNYPDNEFEDVSIIISNTCNLKCTSCVSGASYVRSVEMHKLGLTKQIPVHISRNPEIDFLNTHPIKTLTLLGGEPFIDSTKELLDKLIRAGRSADIDLRLNSNCTMITPQWLEYLNSNFKSTMIKISLDGVGKVNDYLRYPSDWDNIVKNISMFPNYSNITSVVTGVVSNISLIKFYQLIEWCVKQGYHDLFAVPAVSPAQMQVSNLPIELKQELLVKYVELRDRVASFSPRIAESIAICIDTCNKTEFNADAFDESIKWFRLHDQHRKNNLFEVFPELIPYAKT